MGTVSRIARAGQNVILGRAAESYLATLAGACMAGRVEVAVRAVSSAAE